MGARDEISKCILGHFACFFLKFFYLYTLALGVDRVKCGFFCACKKVPVSVSTKAHLF